MSELELTISLLNAAFESTADGLLVVDLNGKIVKYNAKFALMWRIEPEILASGQDQKALAFVLDQLLRPEEFLAKVQELYACPDADSYDLLEFKDGRYFERYSQPQRLGETIVGRVWSFRDVTQKKRTEQELFASRRQLEEFISIAAHELRTPLTSVRAHIQLINHLIVHGQLESYSQEKLTRLVQLSDHELGRFSELIGTLLDFSRITAGRLTVRREETDLAMLVRDVLENLEPQLKEADCPLELDLPTSLRGCLDRYRTEQIVINLVSNAIKWGRGKAIGVVLELVEGQAELRVRDEGPGISKQDQTRLFQRFESLSQGRAMDGMGLGLFITKEIVLAHRGSIEVRGDLGKGSEFVVRLPLGA